MNNWLFAIIMFIVAVILNIIVTVLLKITKSAKAKRKNEKDKKKFVRAFNGEYLDVTKVLEDDPDIENKGVK